MVRAARRVSFRLRRGFFFFHFAVTTVFFFIWDWVSVFVDVMSEMTFSLFLFPFLGIS